jgi:pimeloyl-ACP methyl ester carboxylesterase
MARAARALVRRGHAPRMTTYAPCRAPERSRVVLRGLPHQLTRWPGSDPRPIVLLHGWMDAGATYQFLADALPDTRTLVALDWRGFGGSDWPADGYWFPDYYADLDALLDELSPTEAVSLVGHSMGGNVSMSFAGIRPDRVRALVCIDAFGLPRTRPEQAPERFRNWLAELRAVPTFARFPSFEAFAAFLRKRNPRLTPERADFIARSWATESKDGGIRMRADPRHKRINPILYRREEAEASWRAITAPFLMVTAAASDAAGRFGEDANIEHWRQYVRDLEHVVIDDASHMVHHDRPGPLAVAIERFLAAHI